MTPPEDFTLTEPDKHTPLWIRLKAHLEQRLMDARKRNDGALSEADTASLRGEIKSLRHLIKLGDTRTLIDQ